MNTPITIECKVNPPNDADRAITKLVGEIRNHLSYTQEYVTEKAKIDLKQYHYREQGWIAFSGSELHEIAIVLSVPVQTFFSGIEGEILNIENLIFYARCENELTTALYDFGNHKNPNEFLNEFRIQLEDLIESKDLH